MGLFLVEFVILPLPLAEINLGIIIIPVNIIFILILGVSGLIGWYYITIKYFWSQINRMKKEESKKS
ncbi:unnamed protein product [marine sediment metagenome]|uniref:Uncharacterized protein n=1 Tax=marine sediment metagenome TaxID=412755 RepID=X1CQQ4_9ZZZZ